MAEALAALSRIGLVPVITIESPRDAVPLAEALLDGGIACAEVTFRTPAAGGAIHGVSSTCGGLLVGAGAGLTGGQAGAGTPGRRRDVAGRGVRPGRGGGAGARSATCR